ncbi:MAG: hypothetical protein H2172_04225 [Opitutus sp.]|nr:hypothetical protein [Opitutus sp.]MCS6248100.1 hypothetical protein [Opitutus sp.]MCS6274715.1 hypothetical protein [Opitutus sp.]MCS6278024.1 hypothetical protein [Opitutus sp.]MCS6298868.1 hypothetical protein [Opitutus sp.]
MRIPAFWPRLATRLRNLHPGTRRRTQLVGPFAEVTAATAELNQAMKAVETGFLEIGSILETTMDIERKLVDQSHRLVALSEGPDGGTAIIEQAAAHIWSGIEFAEASDRQVVDLIERLTATGQQIRASLPAQQNLTEALTPLKYVQVLFRVESATLPPEQQSIFLALNTEISRICERVETGFQEKFTIIASIGLRLEDASARLLQRQVATRQQLTSLRTQLEQSIGSVKADYAKNQARDLHVESIVPQVKRETGIVVMSLQAQDMLNQKLQHLHTILHEIGVAHDTMPSDRTGGGRTLRFIEQASGLVTAQLEVMTRELSEAGRQVGGGLGRIVQFMTSLNQDFGMKQEAQADDISIDGGIQNLIEALENVGKLIRASNDLVTETHRAIEPIRGMSTQFTVFMRDLTLDIHLIGLNAEVQSAHVAQGTGLEVVSARATEVSITTCRLSEQLATEIDKITNGLGDLIDSFGQVRAQTESFFAQLILETTADEDRLHSYRDRTIDILLQIGEQLPLLDAQINTAVGHSDFSSSTVKQIEALHARVVALQTRAATTADAEGVTTDTTGLMDRFLKGYTMQSQVDVHNRALGTGAAVLGAAAATVATAGAASGVAAGGASGAIDGASGDVDLFGFDDLPPVAGSAGAGPVAAATTVGEIDLWGDDPVPLETAPVPTSVPTPGNAKPAAVATAAAAMDVELWGDDPVVESVPAAEQSPQRNAA